VKPTTGTARGATLSTATAAVKITTATRPAVETTSVAKSGEAPTSPALLTLVHTNGLGTLLTGVSGIDKARANEIEKRLAALREKHKDALFVDSGNVVGPAVLLESQFGLPTLRMLDRKGFAAVGLSARDGIHSLSFYRLLPFGTTSPLPLVSVFEQSQLPMPQQPFQRIVPASAKIERGGAKVQFFAAATTSALTGVPAPYTQLRLLGDVAAQADYIAKNLEPGYFPVVLSDLKPAENDELAEKLARRALIFEGSYPWLLARPPADQKPARQVGPVRIVSHFSPGEADVVFLAAPSTQRPDREGGQAEAPSASDRASSVASTQRPDREGGHAEPGGPSLGVPPSGGPVLSFPANAAIEATVRSETFWTPQKEPADSKKAGFENLVQSWFTSPLHLPEVGIQIGKREMVKDIMIPYDEQDLRRVPPLGESSETYLPPAWMKQTKDLRGNYLVYRYDLFFNGKPMAHLYRLQHNLAQPFTLVNMLVAADKEHRLYRTHAIMPPMIISTEVPIGPLLERLKGKRAAEIQLDDWPERGGAEFVVDNLVRDIQMLLAIDEKWEE
jgi:hypothetical protein